MPLAYRILFLQKKDWAILLSRDPRWEEGIAMDDKARLAAYQDMQQAIEAEYQAIEQRLQDLKQAGKTKSLLYKESYAWKMQYKSFLAWYEKYGLK